MQLEPAIEQPHGIVAALRQAFHIREIFDGYTHPSLRQTLVRGCRRLAICFAVGWFVCWTCAYVIGAHASENYAMTAGEGISTTGWIILVPLFVAATLCGLRWVILGFRLP